MKTHAARARAPRAMRSRVTWSGATRATAVARAPRPCTRWPAAGRSLWPRHQHHPSWATAQPRQLEPHPISHSSTGLPERRHVLAHRRPDAAHARRQLPQPLGAFLGLGVHVVGHQQPRAAQQVAQRFGAHTRVATAQRGDANQVAGLLPQQQGVELAYPGVCSAPPPTAPLLRRRGRPGQPPHHARACVVTMRDVGSSSRSVRQAGHAPAAVARPGRDGADSACSSAIQRNRSRLIPLSRSRAWHTRRALPLPCTVP
jgi:hypothetical protein